MSLRREPSSPSLRRIRTLAAVCALAVAASLLLTVPATPAGANDAPSWLATVNTYRQSRGLPPLVVDSQLSGLAQQQAQVMADQGQLSHTSNLSAGVSANWTKLGENVGMGRDLPIIWDAFLNSPAHHSNLIDPGYTHIGIGVVIAGNTQWVTHRFMGVSTVPAADPGPAPVYVPPAPTAPRATTPPATRPAPTTTTTVPVPEPEPQPEPVVVPAASAPDRAAALLDALHHFDR